MSKLFTLLLITLAVSASAQRIIKTEQVTGHSIHIIGSNFEGIIFTKEYKAKYPVYDTLEYTKNKWFTPSANEILIVEKILKSQLKSFDKNSKYRNGKLVLSRINEYYQQYIGCIEPDGSRIVYINSFSKYTENAEETENNNNKNTIPQWYLYQVENFDGGPSVWHAKINLHSKKIITFYVNGVS